MADGSYFCSGRLVVFVSASLYACLGSPLQDLKLYVTAPLRWDGEDWLYFGGALAAIGGSHALDGRVRSHFSAGCNAALTGEDKNSLRDALPTIALIAGTGIGALFFRNSDGCRETWGFAEAGILGSATSEAFHYDEAAIDGSVDRIVFRDAVNQFLRNGHSLTVYAEGKARDSQRKVLAEISQLSAQDGMAV